MVKVAVLLATGGAGATGPFSQSRSSVMLPVGDRPILQHAIECLVAQGVERVFVVACDGAGQVESLVGTGARWGIVVQHDMVRDPARPFAHLPAMQERLRAACGDEPLWLAWGDTCPVLPPVAEAAEAATGRVRIRAGEQPAPRDWCRVTLADLASLDSDADEAAYANWLAARDLPHEATARYIHTRDPEGVLQANVYILQRDENPLLLGGSNAEPGVWLSRNVMLHPSVQIRPPVYIGPDCRIEEGAVIGPQAVIGQHCVVDALSTIQESLVMAGSYIGSGLEVEHSIVDRNLLVNVPLGSEVTITDTFILGSTLESDGGLSARRVVGWLLALIALAGLWPLVLLVGLVMKLRGRRRVRPFVRLPAATDTTAWGEDHWITWEAQEPPAGSPSLRSHFVSILLPGLWQACRGRLDLVGLPPRDNAGVLAMSSDWRALYLQGRPGLIHETLLLYDEPTADDAYTADAFAVAAGSLGQDLRLLWRYLRGLILGARRVPAAAGEPEASHVQP